jgi:hypothetical protein
MKARNRCSSGHLPRSFLRIDWSWVAASAYVQRMGSAIGRKARGFTAIGIFLFFGAVMAGLAAITLLWRGTPLDRLWVLNQMAYKRLAPPGCTVGILFLLLGAALATAGIG